MSANQPGEITQQASSLSLHGILAQIEKRLMGLDDLKLRLQDIEREVVATRTLLGKRRLPRSTQDTRETIASEMHTRIDDYWQNNHSPMQLHLLARVFARRLGALGISMTEMLPLLESKAKRFLAGSGGYMLIPLSIWNSVHDEQRNSWMTLTPKDIAEKRQVNRMLAEGNIPIDLTKMTVIASSHSEGTLHEKL